MKRPPLTRWTGIVLRAAHTACVILLGAALLHGAPAATPAMLVLVSGATLFALDLWQFPGHAFELSGIAVMVKLLMVAVMAADESLRLPMFWLIVLWSGVFSHAPANLRHLRLTRNGWVRK
ncbi:MAG: hypothetical protein KDH17_06960 [Rhodocyclaceae bacterium]|nr:hypothetical protein [Rhodocyclaceae bacterium]